MDRGSSIQKKIHLQVPNYISQDLLLLIVLRLPVKTLIRFKCVSQSWKQQIESTGFALEHLSMQTPRFLKQNVWGNDLDVLDPHTVRSISDVVTIPGTQGFAVRFVASVHGVICYLDRRGRLVSLWNPSTRQRVTLPYAVVGRTYLEYFGFWIDPHSKEFKIIIFVLETWQKAFLYSSVKRAWTEFEMNDTGPAGNYKPVLCNQVMVDGVAYWKAHNLDSTTAIIFFDFGQDKFGALEPPSFSGPQRAVNVYKWRGFLAVARWNVGSRCGYELWVMRENGSWDKMFRCNLMRGFLKDVLCVMDCGRVLGLTRNRDILLFKPSGTTGRGCCTRAMMGGLRVGRRIVACDHVESFVFPDLVDGWRYHF